MVSRFTCYIAQMKPLNSYKLKSKWCRLETRWRRGFLSLVARVTHSRAATLGAFSRKRSRSFPVFAIMRTCRPFPAPLTVTRNTHYNSEYEPLLTEVETTVCHGKCDAISQGNPPAMPFIVTIIFTAAKMSLSQSIYCLHKSITPPTTTTILKNKMK